MMPTVELAINMKASQALPARKLKVLLADVLPEGGTAAEQAQAVLDWIVGRAKDALADGDVSIGSRQYDVMLAAVAKADGTWDAARVQQDGIGALTTAYDALGGA
jgi:hypothetical protein